MARFGKRMRAVREKLGANREPRPVDEAFALRSEHPEWILMGEVDGLPVEGFDLPNSLACQPQLFTDFFESVRLQIVQTESHPQHFFLSGRQCSQHLARLLGKVQVNGGIGGKHKLFVFDKISEMGIFLFFTLAT